MWDDLQKAVNYLQKIHKQKKKQHSAVFINIDYIFIYILFIGETFSRGKRKNVTGQGRLFHRVGGEKNNGVME